MPSLIRSSYYLYGYHYCQNNYVWCGVPLGLAKDSEVTRTPLPLAGLLCLSAAYVALAHV